MDFFCPCVPLESVFHQLSFSLSLCIFFGKDSEVWKFLSQLEKYSVLCNVSFTRLKDIYHIIHLIHNMQYEISTTIATWSQLIVFFRWLTFILTAQFWGELLYEDWNFTLTHLYPHCTEFALVFSHFPLVYSVRCVILTGLLVISILIFIFYNIVSISFTKQFYT